MPSRYHNIYEDGAVCFWTSAIVKRVPVFSSRTAARALIATLDECRKRCDVKLLGYVIMPDHIHLAVWSQDSRKVARFLQQFLAISSSRIAALAEQAADRGDSTAAAWLDVFKGAARRGCGRKGAGLFQ